MIVGFAGRKGSGKDTAAGALADAKLVKFADPLKDMVRACMLCAGVSGGTITRCVDGDMRETPLHLWGNRTTRYVMQTLGTEWGRSTVYDRIWVEVFRMRAIQVGNAGRDVACTDVRFPNEVDAIHALGGKVLFIERPGLAKDDTHASEDVDQLERDATIVNDGTVDDLHFKVIAAAYSEDHI